MNRTILYYPTMDIPNGDWLRHALLYWDEVSSIIPRGWNDSLLLNLSPEIQYLMREGQFRPINPEELILRQDNWDVFNSFKEEFEEKVLSLDFQSFMKRSQKSNSQIHVDKIGVGGLSSIHSNKTSDELFYFLQDQGLAKRQTDQPEWLLFENNIALLYMSLLAKYLADVDASHTTISTNYFAYEKFNFKRVNQGEGFPTLGISLENILPTPTRNVSFEKIIDFKRRRADNLLHFKLLLSNFQQSLAQASSNAEIKEITINFQEAILSGVSDLTATLKDANIANRLKRIKSLFSLQSAPLLTSLGIAANQRLHLFNIPMEWAAVGVGLTASVELASGYIESRNERRATLRESAFSYIYEARKSNILSDSFGRRL